MKKLDRKKMEARLQTMMNEPEDISEERMEAIKQRAHDEYLRRIEAQAAQKAQHRKSLHHRAIAVAVLVLALLVLPVVYTVLMPVTVGSANNVIRTAGIWINNTFHLGIEFSEPIPENENFSDVGDDDVKTFATVEEAAAYLKCPIYVLDQNVTGASPSKVDVNFALGDIAKIVIEYDLPNAKIDIIQKPLLSSNVIGIENDSETIQCQMGEIIVWKTEDQYHGLFLSEGWSVHLLSSATDENVEKMYETLHLLINEN